jgi:hypothetical protein
MAIAGNEMAKNNPQSVEIANQPIPLLKPNAHSD